ncbi:efflux RND transporter periplasmic adaptor subunit [Mangrovibacterium diazotrophicum]|uniref:Cobalt-zinc-cadmium efflux system membrane fusion protein n=1 Tax=Mangrovibacterium diazotrophicum TaxID=1261403 RepID=A0A419WA51_9BACT|nr:efflux RND transporter periplasmic adaptor subunit [Mangrovibacterium diazotrophicum]RKD92337.1 cobalt-zinc-cadmium efflux system membrane fusion protein [Mangrovibacterium diazotrophicum]
MIYSKLTSLSACFLFAIALSCSSGEKSPQATVDVRETPPSVSGTETGKLLIRLSDKEKKELTIETQRVSTDIKNYSLMASGVVFPATNHVSVISTPVDGRVSAIMVRDGQLVKKGQELFKLESLVFGNLVAEYLQAAAEEKFQTTRLERVKQLVDQTISSKSELDRAQSDYERARTASIASVAKLKAIGFPDHEVEALKNADQIDPSLKIHAPIAGSFDQLQVELGQSVNALDKLGRIIDLQKVLVRGYLSPEDARFVQTGDTVRISRRDDDSKKILAYISSVNPGLDEDNRSVVVNVEVAPENEWPKPGENVRLAISAISSGEVFAVPLKAVTYDGNQAVVFVKKDDGVFEKRFVDVAEIRDQFAIVKSGMQENEEVAVSQIFSLKALSRYELISEE